MLDDISNAIRSCECVGMHSHAMALAYENLLDALFWANVESRDADGRTA